ncbi:hypothetical protein [Nocardia farcinica]|uniref:hypothetical protein n=1 Tax=Nocardia farcinica TaxID=37329 RepID=UPI002455F524|nr:hypothetical protein [Nocardia farcinica]
MTTTKVMAKLSDLRALPDGWMGPGSQAVTETAVENYLLFLAHLKAFDPAEVEPMASRDGGIRLEWDRGEHSHIAELQGDGGLYLCKIGPADAAIDWESDTFDLSMLTRFYE